MGLAYRGEYGNPEMIELELDLIDARLARNITRTAVPIGMGGLWFAESAPSADWILAQGQALKQTEYPALYALWGITHGTGTDGGATEFSVPDLRSRLILGNSGTGVASTLTETGTFGTAGTAMTYLVVNVAVRAR